MSVVQIVGFGAGYLVFLSFLLFVVRTKTQRQRIQVLVNSVGLPLSSEMEPIVMTMPKTAATMPKPGIASPVFCSTDTGA